MAQSFRKERTRERIAHLEVIKNQADVRPLKKPLVIALGIFTFIVYLLTLHPTVGGGDAGELTVAASRVGIVHPPGYPLFCILGKLLTFLPFGTVAWRVNLLSALCDTGAAVLLFLSVTEWTANVWAGFLAGGLFAFSPLIWAYAGLAEVFALNNFFAAGLIYLSVRYHTSRDRKVALFATFFWGLGLSNHHTLLFYGAPCLAWMLWSGRQQLLNVKTLATMAGLGLLGFLPYLYLPIASSHVPVVGWGNETSFSGLLRHFLRAEYGTLKLGTEQTGNEGELARRIYLYLRFVPEQLLYVLPALSVWGIVSGWRNERWAPITRLWAITACVYVFVFSVLSNIGIEVPLSVSVQSRFFQMANIVVFLFAGIGLATAMRTFSWLNVKLAATFVICAVLLQVGLHYKKLDFHDDWTFADYGHSILNSLPDHSILIIQGDHCFGVLNYLQQSEGFRKTVHVLDQNYMTYDWSRRWMTANYPDVNFPDPGFYGRAGFGIKDFLDVNLSRDPAHADGKFQVFVLNGIRPWDDTYKKTYKLVRMGMVEKFAPIDEPLVTSDWVAKNADILKGVDVEKLRKWGEEDWEFQVMKEYLQSRFVFGTDALNLGTSHGNDPYLLNVGVQSLRSIESLYRPPNPFLYKNLGIAYMGLAKSDIKAVPMMIDSFQRYLSYNPGDPEAPAIRGTIASYQQKH